MCAGLLYILLGTSNRVVFCCIYFSYASVTAAMKQETTCRAGVRRASCSPLSPPPPHPCPRGSVIYHMANGWAVFPTQPRSRCLPQYNLSKRQIEFAATSLVWRRQPEPLGMTVIINTLVQTLIKMATNCRGAGPFGGGGCQWCDRTAFFGKLYYLFKRVGGWR